MPVPESTAPAGAATPGAAARTTPLRVLGRNLFGQQSGSPPSSVDQGDANDVAKAVVMLAEIQKQLMEKNQHQEANNTNGGKKAVKNLTSVRLPEFRGGKSVTTKEYRLWRKMAMAHMQLHRLEPSEMALLLYLSVAGEARETLEILAVSDLLKEDGLALVWKLLDQAHEQLDFERLEEGYRNWETAHRRPQQSMDSWISRLHRLKAELEANDADCTISDRQLAEKMLRGSGLSREKRSQALFNAGGQCNPKRLEAVLRVAHSVERDKTEWTLAQDSREKRTFSKEAWHLPDGRTGE
jgi:hypothetical protein